MELVNLKSGGREEKNLTAQTSVSPAFSKLTILELEETGPLPFPQPPPRGASPWQVAGEHLRSREVFHNWE